MAGKFFKKFLASRPNLVHPMLCRYLGFDPNSIPPALLQRLVLTENANVYLNYLTYLFVYNGYDTVDERLAQALHILPFEKVYITELIPN